MLLAVTRFVVGVVGLGVVPVSVYAITQGEVVVGVAMTIVAILMLSLSDSI